MNDMLKGIALEGSQRVMPRILKLLEALCSVDSESGHEAGNRQVIEILRPVLEELGAQVEEIYEPGLGTHLVARVLPEGSPAGKLLLAAHLDTVFPVGSAAQHSFHIEGDYAWGLFCIRTSSSQHRHLYLDNLYFFHLFLRKYDMVAFRINSLICNIPIRCCCREKSLCANRPTITQTNNACTLLHFH